MISGSLDDGMLLNHVVLESYAGNRPPYIL